MKKAVLKKSVLLSLLCLASFRPAVFAGNVIFIHPDGAGLAQWQAARFLIAGPDGELNWDKLPNVGIYRGQMSDNLTATSNGGAGAHAMGVRVHADSFGFEKGAAQRPVTASGLRESLLEEAKRRGFRTGIINSGDITEPGTAVFAAATGRRDQKEEIALKVIESGADIIMSGGERYLLPQGKAGRHCKEGVRADGRDLIAEAKAAGYTVVFDRKDLAAVPRETKKLLGIFADEHTFNDKSPAVLNALRLPLYLEGAPDLGEMLAKSLEIFNGEKFFLVAEEEGSDNFGNANNASGVFEALRRADKAFGVALEFIGRQPETLLITAADSEAGGLDVIGIPADKPDFLAVAKNGRDKNGAPYGLDLNGEPFLSAPDRNGARHPFVTVWATLHDTSGGIVARAAGKGAGRVAGTIHNTDIYRIMREALFEGPDGGN